MNKVILMGRLTADPEITYYGKGSNQGSIARFTIAVNFNQDHTDFIRCTAFNGTAEIIEEYLNKGNKILIEGRWQTGSFETADGDTAYTNECIINRFEFCESASANSDKKTHNKSRSNKSRSNKSRSNRRQTRQSDNIDSDLDD